MKFELWLIGKNEAYIAGGFEIFTERIKRYVPFEVKYFPVGKKGNNPLLIKTEESKMILQKIDASDHLIILDETGKEFTSAKFAGVVNNLLTSVNKKVIFLIGGSYGIGEELRTRGKLVLSLSQMTFSHQLARLVFAEQLYRAFTILKNEPYHH